MKDLEGKYIKLEEKDLNMIYKILKNNKNELLKATKIIVSKIEKKCSSKTGSLRKIREDFLVC